MKSLLIFLPVFFLTVYVYPQARESTVTIKVTNGNFSVTGLVTNQPETANILTRKIRAVLPAERTIIDIKTDYGMRAFPLGWEDNFDKQLQAVKGWKNGIYIFTKDRGEEKRAAISKLINGHYEAYGDSISKLLVDPKKRATLLYTFATWCGPCHVEIPHLNDLYDKFGQQGLDIIALDFDYEPQNVVKAFAEQMNMKFKIGKITSETRDQFVKFTDFLAIPQSLLFSNGDVVLVSRGGSPKTTEERRKKVEQLFGN